MRAWRLADYGQLSLREETLPEPEGTAVRVGMRAFPVLTYTEDVFSGARPYAFPAFPFTPGTNGVGVVEAVGPQVVHLAPGDRVVVSPFLTADERVRDPACQLIGLTGMPRTAEAGMDAAAQALLAAWPNGTFAEAALLPAGLCTKAEGLDQVDDLRLTLLAKLAVPYGGLVRGGLKPGEVVVVAGASGYFGGGGVQVALSLGAERVVALGRDTASLDALAERFGPRVRATALTGDDDADLARLRKAAGGPADVALDLTGVGSAIALATRALGRGGRSVLMAPGADSLPLSAAEMLAFDWSLLGCFMYPANANLHLMSLLRSGLLDLSRIDVATFAFEGLPEAIQAAKSMRSLDATLVTLD